MMLIMPSNQQLPANVSNVHITVFGSPCYYAVIVRYTYKKGQLIGIV